MRINYTHPIFKGNDKKKPKKDTTRGKIKKDTPPKIDSPSKKHTP